MIVRRALGKIDLIAWKLKLELGERNIIINSGKHVIVRRALGKIDLTTGSSSDESPWDNRKGHWKN